MDADLVLQVNAEALSRASAAMDRLTDRMQNTERSASRFGSAMQTAGGVAGAAIAAAGAAFVGMAVAAVRSAEAYTVLQNKLQQVSTNTEHLAQVTEGVFDVAIRTRQSVDATAQSFARFDMAMKGLGATQAETLRLTETVNKMLVISGATSSEASSGLLQLSQAFNKGKIDGDEFRAMMENMPQAADAIAKELGVTRGELLKLAPEGKITTEVMRKAFANVATEIDAKFGKTVPTIGQAMENLRTKSIKAFGEMDKGAGVTSSIATALTSLGDQMPRITQAFAGFASFAANAFTPLINAIPVVFEAVERLAAAIGDGWERISEAFTQGFGDISSFDFAGLFDGFIDVFSGAIALASGLIAQLISLFADLYVSVEGTGFFEYLSAGFTTVSGYLSSFYDLLSSGVLTDYLGVWVGSFSDLFGRVTSGFKDISSTVSEFFDRVSKNEAFIILKDYAVVAVREIIDAFRFLPTNIIYLVDQAVVFVFEQWEKLKAKTQWLVDAIAALFSSKTLDDALNDYTAKLDDINRFYTMQRAEIEATRDAAINSYSAQIKAAEAYRNVISTVQGQYARLMSMEKGINAKNGANKPPKPETDYLNQVRPANKPSSGASAGKGKKAKDSGLSEYERLLESLLNQEEKAEKEFAKSVALIDKYFKGSSDARARIMEQVKKARDEQITKYREGIERERQSLFALTMNDFEKLAQAQKEQLDKIAASSVLSMSEKNTLEISLTRAHNAEIIGLQMDKSREMIDINAGMFDTMSNVFKTFLGEQNKLYKVFFSLSQGFRMTSELMQMTKNLQAMTQMAQVFGGMGGAGAGGGMFGGIMGFFKKFAGFFDEGGTIPAGKIGMVGERGAELVTRPTLIKGGATVMSRADTRALLSSSSGGGGGGNVTNVSVPVANYNYIDRDSFTSTVLAAMNSSAGQKIVVNIISANRGSLAAAGQF